MRDWVKKWVLAASVRAVKTFCQALAAGIGTTAVAITSLDWGQIVAIAATAAVGSLVTSLAGVPEVEEGESPLAKD